MIYFWTVLMVVNLVACSLFPNGWSFVSLLVSMAMVVTTPFMRRS